MAARVKEFQPGHGYTKEDWDIVSDNPPLTDEELASLRPVAEVYPEFAAALKRARGKQKAPTKQLTAIRLDAETLAAFRATGPGWQSRMSEILKEAAKNL